MLLNAATPNVATAESAQTQDPKALCADSTAAAAQELSLAAMEFVGGGSTSPLFA